MRVVCLAPVLKDGPEPLRGKARKRALIPVTLLNKQKTFIL